MQRIYIAILKRFKIISINHKKASTEEIGLFYIEKEQLPVRLKQIAGSGFNELLYLATCNRVEFLVSSEEEIHDEFLSSFIGSFNSEWDTAKIVDLKEKFEVFEGMGAIQHLFNLVSSLDSMVVGEREIISQVRDAYDTCHQLGLTGDLLRLVTKHAIIVGKKIYSETGIARNPVSVVSLAYRKLKDLMVDLNTKFLIVGAGQTNTSMVRYLKKHGFSNFAVFNRSLENANKLAAEINGDAYGLDALKDFKQGFDVIISCTGSDGLIITKDIYTSLLNGDTTKKIVIDLAAPNDFDSEIAEDHQINLIAINNLKTIAEENINLRKDELSACKKIIQDSLKAFTATFKERQVELAMMQIPEKVKEIKDVALNQVFAKDLERLDESSKETLEKVLAYVEKKYISIPMKMAKKVLLEQS
ncbi:MAG TPA: glutamyl-tRNA reductase [Flavobacteriales bacterium]|nr:glutamyl-tRNA reductase [Flavobacteriales bacterium]